MPASHLASVPDDELDAYIAAQIVKKAKANETAAEAEPAPLHQDDEAGPSQPRVPNTNKRFLSSVIRNVEGHNQALLRQQEREARRKARQEQRGTEVEGRRSASPQTGHSTPPKLRDRSNDDLGRDGSTSPELSNKMDQYFDDADLKREPALDPKTTESPKKKPRSSHERRKDDRRRSDSKSERHRGSSKKDNYEHASRSSSSRHREHRSERNHGSSRKHRERGHSHRDDDRDRRRRHSRDRHRDGKPSKRRVRDDDDTRYSSSRKHDDHHRERKVSPHTVAEETPKTREWDLGKESLAF